MGQGGLVPSHIEIKLSDLPVPDRQYSADTAEATLSSDFLVLAFGQRTYSGTGLRSLVIISVPAEAVRQFITTFSGFDTLIREFVSRNNIDPIPLHPIDNEPDQTVSLRCNVIATAFSGREATMDFYRLSPMAVVHKIRVGKPPVVDPVVRVDMSTSLLVSLVDYVLGIKDKLPEEAV